MFKSKSRGLTSLKVFSSAMMLMVGLGAWAQPNERNLPSQEKLNNASSPNTLSQKGLRKRAAQRRSHGFK